MIEAKQQKTTLPDKTGDNRDDKGRFVPGKSGNMAGRPIGSLSITEEIKKKLLEVPAKERQTYLEKLVSKIVEMAVAGDQQMIKSIWVYMDGTPKEGKEESNVPSVFIID